MCNEAFEQTPFAEVCQTLRDAGYGGIEIAPFTLASSPLDISSDQRREYRDIMQSEGMRFVGLHWLMVSPKGLHVTTPDRALRERSWQHIRDLIDLCADLVGDPGPHGVMVFGSPQQRGTTGGMNRAEATRNYIEGLASVAAQAESRGVRVLVEALPIGQCDVVTTLAEAARIVEEINSPAIQTMFDTHNAVDEIEPHEILVERYFNLIRHVHVNEMDGRHPGAKDGIGDYDFKPVLRTLGNLGYSGWISLEVFDFKLGAGRIAAESLQFLESETKKLNSCINMS
ncbi:MAG: sugar phosphate isomerase/epimerase [Acidobacteriota bacterium]|nr:sugar phosphate isomerase/epimerase [Acidobacteriota bacterium]